MESIKKYHIDMYQGYSMIPSIGVDYSKAPSFLKFFPINSPDVNSQSSHTGVILDYSLIDGGDSMIYYKWPSKEIRMEFGYSRGFRIPKGKNGFKWTVIAEGFMPNDRSKTFECEFIVGRNWSKAKIAFKILQCAFKNYMQQYGK